MIGPRSSCKSPPPLHSHHLLVTEERSAADVTYNTASFPCLVATLERLLKPKDRPAPLLLLAYKQRDEAERDLWAMLNDRGIDTVLVDRVQGAEKTGETEIWVAGVGL